MHRFVGYGADGASMSVQAKQLGARAVETSRLNGFGNGWLIRAQNPCVVSVQTAHGSEFDQRNPELCHCATFTLSWSVKV